MTSFIKNIAFSVLLFFSTLNTFAQDTIFKRNNDKIVAKILEITPTEIKYKKFNFQDGPTYVDLKNDIQLIVYSSGMKETFEKITAKVATNDYYNSGNVNLSSKIDDHKMYYIYQKRKIGQPEMQSILMNTGDKKIMRLVEDAKRARRRETIFIGAFPLGIAGIYTLQYGLGTSSYNSSEKSTLLTIGAFCAALAITCPVISIVNKQKKMNSNSAAIKLYNQKF